MKTTVLILVMCGAAAAIELTPDQISAMHKRGDAQREAMVRLVQEQVYGAEEVLKLAEQGEYDVPQQGAGLHFQVTEKFKTRKQEEDAIAAARTLVSQLRKQMAELSLRTHKIVPFITDRWLNEGETGRLPYPVKILRVMPDGTYVASVTLQAGREGEMALLVGFQLPAAEKLRLMAVDGCVAVTGKKTLTDAYAYAGQEAWVIEAVDLPKASEPAKAMPKAMVPVSAHPSPKAREASRQAAHRP